jgi:hypothetical protein
VISIGPTGSCDHAAIAPSTTSHSDFCKILIRTFPFFDGLKALKQMKN